MPVSTAERIAKVARGLLDAEGAEAVTMRRVAGGVGITAMAVYRHYANRDALLNALADDGFRMLTARLGKLRLSGTNFERRLVRITDVFLDLAFESPRLYELMFLTRREGARKYPEDFRARKSPTANVVADALSSGTKAGYFVPFDVWAVAFEMGALQQGLIMLYLGGRVSLSQDEFRAYCHGSLRRFLRAIRTQ